MALMHQLTKSRVVTPIGATQPITLPLGTRVQRDDFLQAAGLADVFLNGQRITVMTLDLLEDTIPEEHA